MKKSVLFCLLLMLFINAFSQQQIELTDIQMNNLGDTQMYAHKRDEAKTPLDGKVRIITGFTTEYIDAEFKDGYGVNTWEYYRKNKLTISVHFKDGYMDGNFTEYYPGGDIKEKGQYVKGQKNGTWESLKDDGIPKLTEVYDNGSKIKTVTYYTDGKVDRERNFKNGKEHGIDKQYTWEGELKSEKNYVNGKQVGKQMQYYTSNQSNFIQTSNYNEKGQLDGDFSEIFAEKNTVKTKGKYKDGRKVGKWEYGYPHKLYKEEIYEDGKLIETKKLD
ncbi:antitoxin component YwqK of YwqJK toxin-antitoxin module [Dysgonomonas hofstadii]|uniref:Antitoxin component YwqK of YwqJK toxin-antitoxin module n=1 Tax=Dysgonomonas hofstadii TaxID=637886 RepID=A0A840CQ06_9BACT|nr:hypothetical protein [Dysgonomonas hofstadii]MBB4035035.1 antitoxin component YwqK of YwqJK toxin-antitoxin module [Dysgonomonas hofstadii]